MQDVGTLLAIDTSGATASVAVYRDQVLAEMVWQSGRRHSAQLLPSIEMALDLSQTSRADIGVIAVATGPGSYSGLRVGVSTAMGLAFALGIGVAQVPTLDVIAWGQLPPIDGLNQRAIRAAIEIGRGHYATARFHREGPELTQDSEIENLSLDELLELACAEHAAVAVDIDRQTREQVEHNYGSRIDLVPPAASTRRAGFLAELAAVRIRGGEPTGMTVEPIYLH